MVMQDLTLKRFITLSTDLTVDEYKGGLNKYSKEEFIEYFLETQKEDLNELENEKNDLNDVDSMEDYSEVNEDDF